MLVSRYNDGNQSNKNVLTLVKTDLLIGKFVVSASVLCICGETGSLFGKKTGAVFLKQQAAYCAGNYEACADLAMR